MKPEYVDVELPPEIVRELDDTAREEGMTRSSVTTEMLAEWLEAQGIENYI
ncbi:MAG: hypothetical protein ACLFMT_07305 [Halobacteriales archaeon]